MEALEITRDVAAKVLEVVDAGLVSGVGKPLPGDMCVEAAVCFALGLPHGDEPPCVDPALRSFKITLNDADWSSATVRASGLRRLAIAQLGSAGALDHVGFARRLAMMSVNSIVPRVLRLAATMKMPKQHAEAMKKAASECEAASDLDAASDAASYAASAASYVARAASDAAIAATYAASAASYAAIAASVARAASYAASDAARAASDAARAASYAARAASYAARAASYAASAATYAARAASYVASAASYAASADSYAARAASVARAASDAASDAASYAASVARAASDAASAASDKELATVAESVVQILIEMKAPGAAWLDLAPLAEAA